MREPPKPYDELTTDELAEWTHRLTNADDTSRLEINVAVAEVYARLATAGTADEHNRLENLYEALQEWLRRDAERPMGQVPRTRLRRPPRSCGACMCSVGRLEPRARSGD
jgi:hypothetical protein